MGEPESNRATYESPDAVGFYQRYQGLQAPEEAWLRDFGDELRGGRILDIGVGGGRTTIVLAPIASTYVGVDYSTNLVDAARERCPGVDIRQADARDLSDFDAAEFDVAVFSFNGLDSVGHQDRLRILREVHRVLAPGGLFVFATHNRDLESFDRFRWPWPPTPDRAWLGRLRRSVRSYRRHRRLARHGERGDGWAVINDEGHDYGLLNYYITKPAQDAQLRALGFEPLACYRLDGDPWRHPDTDSAYLNYVARRV